MMLQAMLSHCRCFIETLISFGICSPPLIVLPTSQSVRDPVLVLIRILSDSSSKLIWDTVKVGDATTPGLRSPRPPNRAGSLA